MLSGGFNTGSWMWVKFVYVYSFTIWIQFGVRRSVCMCRHHWIDHNPVHIFHNWIYIGMQLSMQLWLVWMDLCFVVLILDSDLLLTFSLSDHWQCDLCACSHPVACDGKNTVQAACLFLLGMPEERYQQCALLIEETLYHQHDVCCFVVRFSGSFSINPFRYLIVCGSDLYDCRLLRFLHSECQICDCWMSLLMLFCYLSDWYLFYLSIINSWMWRWYKMDVRLQSEN